VELRARQLKEDETNATLSYNDEVKVLGCLMQLTFPCASNRSIIGLESLHDAVCHLDPTDGSESGL
jgi:hypothetical protein